ncbi:MAG: type III-B CRISPR module-associated protein Cmr5 [Candidatus Heimdallarchaeota archaeon]|nr:type III-B CRISPR module-associated protein Cmr5 [Candidatus Heimdallarchaeota archaeon]
MKGLEQGRAEFAYKCALEAREDTKVDNDEYKSYSIKILTYIKTNGLGATYAFIKGKGQKSKAYKMIYEQTAEWLRKDEKNLLGLKKDDELVEKVISVDSAIYRATTNEVLAFFRWVSRFADGLMKKEKNKK